MSLLETKISRSPNSWRKDIELPRIWQNKLEVGRVPAVNIEALVVDKQLLGFDAIKELSGVYLTESGKTHFGGLNRCAAISIDELDFSVTYDCRNKEWTASWKWANGHSPSELSNSVQEYAMPCYARVAYENEILQWQRNGWLLPYSEELGPPKGLIPLMAVVKELKQKVRPVLDYQELNGFVDAFAANAEVCAQKLREWQWQGVNVLLLDLWNAYLQIHVNKALWQFQTVIFRGQRFCLTWLGFGLNVAPLIMKSVIDAIESQDHTIKSATSAYVDDILINENRVPMLCIQQHFLDYGLVSKDLVWLRDEARVLGLQVWEKDGTLRWKWGSQILEIPNRLIRQRVFSLCGKLVGPFPICGWLRVTVAFIKHLATAMTKGWEDRIKNASLSQILAETLTRVEEADHVEGNWCTDGKEIKVWVDASSVATGMALETNGMVIEDACWLCPINDAQHINLAELDAALKGINFSLQWEARHFNWKSACEHEGSWRDASQATARNLGIAGERIWTDHRCETREVLSEPCR